jgi:hypothetical protein
VQSLRIGFDPVTWEALKAAAGGSMERAAYLMIQERLGLKIVVETSGVDTHPETEEFLKIFPPLPPLK